MMERYLSEMPSRSEVRQSEQSILEARTFERLLESMPEKKSKAVTRLDRTDLFKNDIAYLRFVKEKKENGKTIQRTDIKVSLFVRGVHGPLLFCTASLENPSREGSHNTGNCIMRLPIIGNRDGILLGRRAFDNLANEVGYGLTEEEQEMLSEKFLDDIQWIPDYHERYRNL
jgi:hypothetical protein